MVTVYKFECLTVLYFHTLICTQWKIIFNFIKLKIIIILVANCHTGDSVTEQEQGSNACELIT